MTNETLKATVLRILRSPGIEKINFQLGGLTVTGNKIKDVARAVSDGRIECQTVDEFTVQNPRGLAPGTLIEARYKEEANTILFSDANYGNAPGEDRTIVHEAVHASFDLTAPGLNTRTLAIDDEAAAVLTEAIYILVCKAGKKGGFTMMVDGPEVPAWSLANEMSVATDGFSTGGIYVLNEEQTRELRTRVGTKWNFVKTTDKLGVNDDTTAQYIYNGLVKCNKKGVCR